MGSTWCDVPVTPVLSLSLFCLAPFKSFKWYQLRFFFETRLSWWPVTRQPRPQLRTDDAGANPWGAHTETCRILSDPVGLSGNAGR